MSKVTNFILLQANVVFNQQLSLYDEEYEDTKEGRNNAFRAAIDKFVGKKVIRISPKISEYILLYKAKIGDNIIYCQLAKRTSLEAFTLRDNSIQQSIIDTYPPLDVFINLQYQQFAIQLNTSVLQISSVVTNIKNLINSLVKTYNIFFNTIDDKREFWDSVTDKKLIKEISFDLVVPNFFNATGAAHDLVAGAKNNLNADSVELTLKNKKGNLKATIESIDSYVKYSSTSGSWKLKIQEEGDKKYRVITSTDCCKKKEIEDDILDLIKNMDNNRQIGKDLYDGLLERLDDLFEKE